MSKRKFDEISMEHELEQIAHIDEVLDRIFVHLDSKTLYKSILPACKQWNIVCQPYLLTNYRADAIESVKNYFLNYDFSRYEGDDKVELCTKNNEKCLFAVYQHSNEVYGKLVGLQIPLSAPKNILRLPFGLPQLKEVIAGWKILIFLACNRYRGIESKVFDWLPVHVHMEYEALDSNRGMDSLGCLLHDKDYKDEDYTCMLCDNHCYGVTMFVNVNADSQYAGHIAFQFNGDDEECEYCAITHFRIQDVCTDASISSWKDLAKHVYQQIVNMKKNRYIAMSDDEGCCIQSKDEVVESEDESTDSDSDDANDTE